MELNVWGYLGAFAASLVLALGFTPLVLRWAVARDVLDRPGLHKSHESPVPYLGGVAMAGAFCIALVLAAVVKRPPSGLGQLAAILGLAMLLSVIGLLDDLRGLRLTIRLAIEVLAGVAMWFAGVQITLTQNPLLDAALTVVWIVGITNAFNFLDNMDGLSAGIAAVGSLTFFLIAAFNSQFLVAALAVALLGCALGFLKHNFHPAKIYMGDAGSLFLGFLLAVIAIKLRFVGPTQVTFFVPLLTLGVAILDTSLVVISRALNKRSPFLGGRDHISHRLVFLGLSVRGAVTIIYAVSILLGGLAVVMSRVDTQTGMLLMAIITAAGLGAGVALGFIPVYETSRRRRAMIMEVVSHEEPPHHEDTGPIMQAVAPEN
jgi:UDP-GlcNAc:undecaprenyl-phosphate GlcNAc-1-phosphate transferase